MEYKNKIEKLLIFFLLLSLVAFFISNPIKNGLCNNTDFMCAEILGDILGIPIFLFSTVIFILLIIFRFTSEQVFNLWWKFAKWYLIISALIIGFSPVIDGTIAGFDKEFMSWFLSVAFLTISLFIIVYKKFKNN